ncbi:MAG: hypothetical protein IIX95_05060, partial [Clostridiales bacterium]|nr:hypothetical protein [Clostridiales bacterium]
SMNTYMTIEEWMFADADAWESIDGKQSSFKPSWTVTDGAEYLYDTDVKTEGKASLKVTFTGVDSIAASPVINTYDGKAFDIAKYKNIKLDIKANAGSAISLVVDGVDYGEAITLQNAEFNTVCFTLDTEIASKAKIGFKISGLTNDRQGQHLQDHRDRGTFRLRRTFPYR